VSYIGAQPTSAAFVTDSFSGNGSTTAFTMSVAPANTSSVLVAISGVLQDPSAYSVSGTTLTFSGAPPAGTGNISARYLGIPASGVTTTAYRTVTEFTATAGQTTFTPASYTVGYINVFRNGVRLGAADFTATNGTTAVLTLGASAGDLITTESFYVSSVLGAIPQTAAAVTNSYIAPTAVSIDKLDSTATQLMGLKNRVINGAFNIDQRRAYGALTGVTGAQDSWLADRFRIGGSAYSTGRSTFQVVQDAPAGFVNSGKITMTAAQSSYASSDVEVLSHIIEGLNVSDFGWGTPNAVPATLSFWTKVSNPGIYNVAIRNDQVTRYSYVAAYTVTAANTWQYITVTVPGVTAGTWGGNSNSSSSGIRLDWNLGSGTGSLATANTWSTGDLFYTTGAVQLYSSSSATMQLTGVQLEKGSTATAYEYRPYGFELLLCQRYQYVIRGADNYYGRYMMTGTAAGSSLWLPPFPVQMRAIPSFTTTTITNATVEGYNYNSGGALGNVTSFSAAENTLTSGQINVQFATGVSAGAAVSWRFIGSPAAASIIFSSEL
jgi:hypothetical protein